MKLIPRRIAVAALLVAACASVIDCTLVTSFADGVTDACVDCGSGDLCSATCFGDCECKNGCDCVYFCNASSSCALRCLDGGPCSVECQPGEAGSGTCDIVECASGRTVCGNGTTVVCDAPCP